MQGSENERPHGGAGAHSTRARHKRSTARGRHKRPTAHGRHRQPTGRAHLKLTAAALGLTVVVGGAAAAREAANTSSTGRSPAQATASHGSASPFVIRPVVRLEAPHAPLSATTPVAHPARGVPRWLSVPGLGVGAPVVGVGAPGGVLRPPGDPHVLGWWRGGAQPGAAKGSSLIAGHTVSGGGGVFDDLDRLQRGSAIEVGTTAGVVDYEVTRVRIYRKSTLAQHAARVFSQSVAGRLVLVTCEDWNGTAYLSNVVVFATAVR